MMVKIYLFAIPDLEYLERIVAGSQSVIYSSETT